jgi:hypothetical protein
VALLNDPENGVLKSGARFTERMYATASDCGAFAVKRLLPLLMVISYSDPSERSSVFSKFPGIKITLDSSTPVHLKQLAING